MHVLFDIVHPAHVHFFKNMIRELRERGHQTAVLAREKDVTSALLDAYGIEHTTLGRPSTIGRAGQLVELVRRDLVLAKMALRMRADVICTRNPAGVQAARLVRAVGIFDTDDGSAAGIHFQAARPFAHHLTSPDCLDEDWGPRHTKYPGYKQSAYLHPDHFTPNPAVLDELGLKPGEPFFVARFVAMDASHDKGERGMSMAAKRQALEKLEKHGRVFVSVEGGKVPDEWSRFAYKLKPHRLHDLLAFARLYLGDSQTMAAEAAFLGTPALRVSSFAGRLALLDELEHKYGLTWSYAPADEAGFAKKLDELLAQGGDARASIAAGRTRMLGDKINIARWYTDFIERCGRA